MTPEELADRAFADAYTIPPRCSECSNSVGSLDCRCAQNVLAPVIELKAVS